MYWPSVTWPWNASAALLLDLAALLALPAALLWAVHRHRAYAAREAVATGRELRLRVERLRQRRQHERGVAAAAGTTAGPGAGAGAGASMEKGASEESTSASSAATSRRRQWHRRHSGSSAGGGAGGAGGDDEVADAAAAEAQAAAAAAEVEKELVYTRLPLQLHWTGWSHATQAAALEWMGGIGVATLLTFVLYRLLLPGTWGRGGGAWQHVCGLLTLSVVDVLLPPSPPPCCLQPTATCWLSPGLLLMYVSH